MEEQRIVLQKIPAEKREENPKLPYFRLVVPPLGEGGEWVELGVLWQAKSGNGYSGKLNDGVRIINESANISQVSQAPQHTRPGYVGDVD